MKHQRTVQLGISLVFAAFPFLAVSFPPISDLPQHAAQIRLLDELLGIEAATVELSDYTIRWWAPGNLVYGIFFLWARVLDPIAAARASMATLSLLLVLAFHALARARDRPPEHATLASLLVFSISLYWGFVGFMLGAVIFLLLLPRLLAPLDAPPDALRPWRSVGLLAAAITFIYVAHSLWLMPAALALLIGGLREGKLEIPPLRALAIRLSALVPAAFLSLLWLPELRAERAALGFDLGLRYLPMADRLSVDFLCDVILGGLREPLEPLLLVFLFAWVALGIARSDGVLDRALLAVGVALLLFALLGPDAYLNTRHMNLRFGFVGGALLLLATPRMPVRESIRQVLPGLALLVLVISTASSWRTVEARELRGLPESLTLDPRPARVLGLDYVGMSDAVRTPPFLQLFAWRQALYGGELSFSFAEHQAGIVGFAAPRERTWTPGLEWRADLATVEDLRAFDQVLVVGELPASLRDALTPLTDADAPVRLYSVRSP